MLAKNGGIPIRNQYLAYGKQSIDEQDIAAVIEVLRSPMLTQGPMIERFEQKIADYVGVKYAVAFCNGTAALHGAYYAAGVTEGDEVITTPITFVATTNAVLYLGGKPVFADINGRTYNLDVSAVEKKITSKTKVITSVDFSGQPADYDAFRKIADKNNLVYISDGAHSFGARYKGVPVGSQADLTMFSFHPVKPITTGEGGVIVTNSEDYYKKLKLFRSHGIINDPHLLERNEGPWYYEMVELGLNYRMTDIQAALGISQFDKLEAFILQRRRLANLFNTAFSNMEGIITPYQQVETESGWHLYILRFDLSKFNATRREMFEALRAENIGVHVHYIPVYFQPYYKNLGYDLGICPIAEKWYEEVITLPLFPKMSKEDTDNVVEAIKKIYREFKK